MGWSRLPLPALALVLLAAVPGCDLLPTGQVLEPGGSLVHEGFAVAATPQALDEAVEIRLEIQAEPALDVALPAGVVAHGDVVRVSADDLISVSPDTPLVLGLPLPDGVEPRNLAVGVLESGGRAEYTAPDPDFDGPLLPEWTFLPAAYDAELGMLLVPVLRIDEASWEARIVEGSTFETAETVREGERGSIGDLLRGPAQPAFQAVCGPLFQAAGVTETCGATERQQAAQALEDVYNDLTGLGFTDDPHLFRHPDETRVRIVQLLPFPRFEVVVDVGAYEIELRPDSQTNAGGMFSSGAGTVWISIAGGGLTAGDLETVRHEYFHATQYGYDPTFVGPGNSGWLRARWSIEGQAVLSQESDPTIERDNRNPRNVDDTLFRSNWTGTAWTPGPTSEYEAQDFWAWLAARYGEADLSFLVPFLEEGQEPEDVDAVLRNTYADYAYDGLASAYWDWARNQTFEKEVDIGDGVLGAPCTFRTDSADALVTVTHDGTADVVQRLTVPPMTAFVVQFDVDATSGPRAEVDLTVERVDPDLRIKFYDPADAGNTACWSDPELSEETAVAPAGGQAQRFALVANTSMSLSYQPLVTAVAQATVTIEQPDAGYREGDDMIVEATLVGPPDASTRPIRWSYEDSLGAVTTLPDTVSGEVRAVSVPCDDLLLRAEVDVTGGGTVFDVKPVSCLRQTDEIVLHNDRSLGGVVTDDGQVYAGDSLDTLEIGDDASNVGQNGFLHFSLGSLPDDLAQIRGATLTLSFESGGTAPGSAAPELIAVHGDYGTLDASDYRSAGGTTFLPGLARFSDTSFGAKTVDVTTAVADAWSNRGSRGEQVQFLLYFDPGTDNDGVADLTGVSHEDRPGTTLQPVLEVEYDNFLD